MNIDINIYYWDKMSDLEKKNVLVRPSFSYSKKVKRDVKKILNNVKKSGDLAVHKYNFLLDKIKLTEIKINCDKIKEEDILVSKMFKKSILHAKKNIEKFHNLQKRYKKTSILIEHGINCRYIEKPISNVGIYIPKGVRSNLFSTMLMLCIPAKIAGCKNIVVCSPPSISNELLYTAKICNIKNVFQVGGAQAIAAMAFGTNSIAKVDKIFGPGNFYVTEAKNQVSKMNLGVSIDMLAGPSELVIIADKYSNAGFIASDLIAQLEHGKDSHTILLSNSISLIKKVYKEINLQILDLPRKAIVKASLLNSKFIFSKDLLKCIHISNIYAPEHLSIYSENYNVLLKYVENAGSIFLGSWSAVAIGDYCSGTNHVLPTYGYASSVSGIGLKDFIKNITIQELTCKGFLKVSNTVEILSNSEGLDGHERSIKIRNKYLKETKNFELQKTSKI
ncbi:histidinol dehydrogenase [Buchnera aphidicola (Chaitoregma tattakana)]|uniref:histidinol dehydrogenase n=1 Tax=Buchnera aphidicola TaxID=9 RepID=UPI0031B8ACFA